MLPFMAESKNWDNKKSMIQNSKIISDPLESNRKFNHDALKEEAYSQLDVFFDSFAEIADVQTDLMFGDPAAVPEPMISVVLPTFQRGQFLREALESVCNQQKTDFDWECLVMDNTPLDNLGTTTALEMVRQMGDPRVLYYHNRVNIGPGYNWNRGVELARGKWICFLHDDDVLFPDALRNIERIIQCQAKGRKPLGCIQARRVLFTEISELQNLIPRGVPYFEPLTRTRALIRGESGTGAPSCGTVFLKQAYLECGGVNYDFGLTADAVLGYQIMKHYRVIRSDCVLGGYRWAENETLKKTTLQKLVYSDYLFACYRYRQSLFSKLWGKLFWRAEYNENVRYKIKDGKKGNIVLTPTDFNEIVPYRKTNPVVYLLYKILQRVYSLLAVMCGYRSGDGGSSKTNSKVT